MIDPVAAGDQMAEEVKAMSRIHAAYYNTQIKEGIEPEVALSNLQTMMWIWASKANEDDCDCEGCI